MDWEAGSTSVASHVATIFPIPASMNRPSKGWLVSHVTSDGSVKLSGRMMEAFRRPVLPFW